MDSQHPIILGIETSCDDTACAVVDGSGRVLASVVSSQLAAHRPYGGVVPEIASREHLKNWPLVSEEALKTAGIELEAIDAVAATRGPGLVGSLLVGLSVGRAIAFGLDRPFYGMNHLEGHLYSPFLEVEGEPGKIPGRFEGLVVSGGHTTLLDVRGDSIASLVETRDDAMGEVFDKVGKRLGLAYPQGPKVDALAEEGDPERFRFTMPRIKDESFFSYSGIKTQALRMIEELEDRELLDPREIRENPESVPEVAKDLLACFRRSTVDQIVDRLDRQHARRAIRVLAVSGGVAANRLLRRHLASWAERHAVDLRLVPLKYSGDNAAMIAFAALERHRRGSRGELHDVEVASRIPFSSV